MMNHYYTKLSFRWCWVWLMLLVLLPASLIKANATSFNNGEASHSFLPLHEAFQFSGSVNSRHQATVHIKVADGYYLYKTHLSFHAANSETQLGNPSFPAGIEILDPFMNQDMIVFPESTDIVLPYETTLEMPKLKIKFQGCARAGLCYPPSEITINLIKVQSVLGNIQHGEKQTSKGNVVVPKLGVRDHNDEDNKYFTLLSQQHNLFVVLGLFFLAGILLAFTPCVLPMVPILSATLASSAGNRRRTTILTITYIIFMSATYAVAGCLVGLFGATLNIQAWLQSPWVIISFALLFVVLALSMFGLYELQLPAWLRNRVLSMDANVAEKKKGSVLGAGFMGICSALVVSPCITAPLVGALLYISSTQNAVLGGGVLFSLGLGMGVPLLAVGVGLGHCIPKSGVWMEKIKYTFGVLMLAISIWLISRIVSAPTMLILWGVFAFFLAALSLLSTRWNSSTRLPRKVLATTLGGSLFVYGVCLVAGGLMGSGSFTRPLAFSSAHVETTSQNLAEFTRITTPKQLQQLQQQAIRQHRPLLLDFYADWCESCKRMDHNIFEKPVMAPLLSKFMLVRFDITKTTGAQLKMMKSIQVFGAPTIILYGSDGKEQARQVGEVSMNRFRKLLEDALSDNLSKNPH